MLDLEDLRYLPGPRRRTCGRVFECVVKHAGCELLEATRAILSATSRSRMTSVSISATLPNQRRT